MNFCNFAKVIISRSTKDKTSIELFNCEDNVATQETEKNKPQYNTSLTLRHRYENYNIFMHRYPKMQLKSYEIFRKKVGKLQDYTTKNKYYANFNKSGEREKFINHFDLLHWAKLEKAEKKQHQLEDCFICTSVHAQACSLHSVSTSMKSVNEISKTLVTSIKSISHTESAAKVAKSVVHVLNPVFTGEFQKTFEDSMTESLNLSPRDTPQEKRKKTNEILRENTKTINEAIQNDNEDVTKFLSSGKSYAQYERERKLYFTSKPKAKENMILRVRKELESICKPKKHHGNYKHYIFEKENCLEEISSFSAGSIVNWSALARKYNVKTINGQIPANRGQVVMSFAKDNGIDIYKFNTQSRLSGRDYLRRVKRAKKKLLKSKVTMPLPRSAKKLKGVVRNQIKDGIINVGKPIAPKKFISNAITKEGSLSVKEVVVFGRKIPLGEILQNENQRIEKTGILRLHQDSFYDKMTKEDIIHRLQQLNECNTEEDTNSLRNKLKAIERTRQIKVWHDHSCILNHTYINFMINYIYDNANFLTDEEFKQQNPTLSAIDCQKIVEKPQLYILGQSASTDKDQITYINARLEDIELLAEGTTYKGITFNDRIRIFSGDNPARQFESGQQRGGQYSCLCGVESKSHVNLECCFTHKACTLEERQQILMQGKIVSKKLKERDLNPLRNMKKDDIIDELEDRLVNTHNWGKPRLQQELNDILHGISRPPAMMTTAPEKSAVEVNLESYEVMMCEPLHDLSNVLINFILELPHHAQNNDVKSELEAFSSHELNERNQIKGADARKLAIKLCIFIQSLFNQKKVPNDWKTMIEALVDIVHIAYSSEASRSPRQILRLFNSSFLFATLAKSIIGNPVKMTSRKFYGNHFHSTVTHLPEAYRMINAKSILTEDSERSFGSLKRISENTSNRKAGYIIENAIVRYRAQENDDDRADSSQKQESEISKLARSLPPTPGTTFSKNFLKDKWSVVQYHLSRIAAFLLPGENIWWHFAGEDIVFHDSVEDEAYRPEGPNLSHLRSSSLQNEFIKNEELWQNCIALFEKKVLSLPIQKIKISGKDGKLIFLTNTRKQDLTPLPTTQTDNESCNSESVDMETLNIETDHDLIPLTTTQLDNESCNLESVGLPTINIETDHDLTPLPTTQSDNDSCSKSVELEIVHSEAIYDEEPAFILSDKESYINHGDQLKSTLMDIFPGDKATNLESADQNKSPSLQESRKNLHLITLRADVHFAFAAEPLVTKCSEQEMPIISSCGDHVHHLATGTCNHTLTTGDNELGRPKPSVQPSIARVHQLSNNIGDKEKVKRPKPDVQLSTVTRFKQLEDNKVKAVYNSYIKGLLQMKKPLKKVCKEQSTARPGFPRAKRQLLFEEKSNLGNQADVDDEDPFEVKSKTVQNIRKINERSDEERMSTMELVETLLGTDNAAVQSFKKYRRLTNQHPAERSFRDNYEKTKAVIGFKILAKHSQMKRNQAPALQHLQSKTELLLNHWDISTKHLRF